MTREGETAGSQRKPQVKWSVERLPHGSREKSQEARQDPRGIEDGSTEDLRSRSARRSDLSVTEYTMPISKSRRSDTSPSRTSIDRGIFGTDDGECTPAIISRESET